MKTLWKPGAMLAPVPPALVSCGTMEHPNLFTVAWTGICNTIPPMLTISVRPQRYSYGLIRESGEFVLNLPTVRLARAVDFCGVRSGRDTDKWAAMGLHPQPAQQVSAPLLQESPLNLECRVRQMIHLGSHDLFLCDIVAVDVEEELIDRSGKLHLERSGLLAYAHGDYFSLGERIGSFGYSVRRKAEKGRWKAAPSPSLGKPRGPKGAGKNGYAQDRMKGRKP